jgi:hypothetical protein
MLRNRIFNQPGEEEWQAPSGGRPGQRPRTVAALLFLLTIILALIGSIIVLLVHHFGPGFLQDLWPR